MSRRTPQFMLAAPAALLLLPAGASAAALSVHGASGTLTAKRDIQNVTVKGTVTDTVADGHCVYIEAEIVHTRGHNPDRVIARACGKGVSKSGRWDHKQIDGYPRHVDAKICRERNGPDACNSYRVAFS